MGKQLATRPSLRSIRSRFRARQPRTILLSPTPPAIQAWLHRPRRQPRDLSDGVVCTPFCSLRPTRLRTKVPVREAIRAKCATWHGSLLRRQRRTSLTTAKKLSLLRRRQEQNPGEVKKHSSSSRVKKALRPGEHPDPAGATACLTRAWRNASEFLLVRFFLLLLFPSERAAAVDLKWQRN